MINPLRQVVSVALTLSLLTANGFYLAPLLKTMQNDKASASMQNCCCCNSGGGTSSDCCCASRHSGGNNRNTCSISTAPCGAPLTAISLNVLDQGIEPPLAVDNIVRITTPEKFSDAIKSPQSGKLLSLFHPPQPFFSLFLS